MKMAIKVVFHGLRESKGKFYGTFLFIGGSFSVPVSSDQKERLLWFSGQDIEIVFSMRPRLVSMYGRSAFVFEPDGIKEIPISLGKENQ